jgi:DNA-binding LacI/PurR family transcriptional regulator
LVADLHNPLFAEIVDAARTELDRADQYGLMTSAVLARTQGHRPQLDSRVLAAFEDLRPRSILVVGSVPDMAALEMISFGIPIVVASAVADHLPSARTVRGDESQGMRLVIDHLVLRGHRKIAHIGGEGGRVATERAQAYEAAMKAHGLDGLIRVVHSDYSEEAGYAAARVLLDAADRPTAITAVNDLAAIGAQSAAADLGLIIPRDIAITGYDNTYLAGIRRISLTSVDPGNAAIGAKAARWLVLREEQRPPVGSEYLVEPVLIVRDSTGGTS